jgi:hypothetical protein
MGPIIEFRNCEIFSVFRSPCIHTDVRQAVPQVTDPGSKRLTTPRSPA